MKTIIPRILLTCILVVHASQGLAIEGLKLSIHCPDVWLSWPSVEWNGETYIVQYRETLDTNSQWITLTNALPPRNWHEYDDIRSFQPSGLPNRTNLRHDVQRWWRWLRVGQREQARGFQATVADRDTERWCKGACAIGDLSSRN